MQLKIQFLRDVVEFDEQFTEAGKSLELIDWGQILVSASGGSVFPWQGTSVYFVPNQEAKHQATIAYELFSDPSRSYESLALSIAYPGTFQLKQCTA